jgi:hypothetical protein
MVDPSQRAVNSADEVLDPRIRVRLAALKCERLGRETARRIAELQREPAAWADYLAEGTALGS